ncbi:MAG TPA: acyltransferase family protein, partial [Chitinophagaceae bacterium]|nr:acyltransferase family protein [Chitinophagaceae bacterium]
MKALYISSESNGDPIAQKPKGLAGSSPKRIKELDGLRGIAILLVLSFHYINNQMVNRTDTLSKAITKATSFGWVGVDLFFVLSGFLIGSILIANKLKDNYFRTFYIR